MPNGILAHWNYHESQSQRINNVLARCNHDFNKAADALFFYSRQNLYPKIKRKAHRDAVHCRHIAKLHNNHNHD